MATLRLELEDDVLARARAAAVRLSRSSLEDVLLARVRELAGGKREDQVASLQELFRLADLHGGSLEGGMPDSEERNAR